MTAPRAPHRPPDRLPSPRGGHPSSQTASAAARRAGFARLASARRGLVCSARALTATALLALVGALALPATAEAQADVLVSSLGLDAASSSVSFGFFEFAKGIATGSNTGGYSLTSVELDVATVPGSITNLVVQIWSASGDADPDAAVITLENPTTLSVGLNTFSAPANSVLNASTSYFLFVSYTGASPYLGLLRNSTGALDDTGLAGWQDENGFAREGGTINAWELSPSGQRMRMRFNGTAVGGTPTPSTDATLSDLAVDGGSANLTLTPTFASGTITYTAMVVSTVTEVTVTQTLGDAGATIEYLDGSDMTLDDADTAKDEFQVAVAEGANVIKVKVTAADGITTLTYEVTVNRAADPTTPSGGPVRLEFPILSLNPGLRQRCVAPDVWPTLGVVG